MYSSRCVCLRLSSHTVDDLTCQEADAFNMMVGRLLNAGFVTQARELASLFEHDSPDLTIVLVSCICMYMYVMLKMYVYVCDYTCMYVLTGSLY